MQRLHSGLAAFVLLVLTVAPLQASAGVFHWVLDGGVWTGLTGSGSLRTGARDGGGFDVIAFAGTIDGLPVDLLGGNPGQVGASPSGAFNYDNIIDPVSPDVVDAHGLLLSIAGMEANIWGNGTAGSYSYWRGSGATYYYSDSAVAFTLSADVPNGPSAAPAAIPEPASAAWFAVALFALNAMRRRVSLDPPPPAA